MAINERLIDTAVAAADGDTGNAGEEGLILHLDANDVDSYDGDGTEWVDITNHEYTPNIDVSEHFNTVLWDGDGASSRNITGVGFQPDLVWIKKRANDTKAHRLCDVVRGAGKIIHSNETVAERSPTDEINAFITDGFTIGNASAVNDSDAADEYVAWCFKAGGVPTATNTGGQTPTSGSKMVDGTAVTDNYPTADIYPTKQSVNTNLGFSITEYTGAGSGKSLPHGLDVPPEMYIVKTTSASSDWWVYTIHGGDFQYLTLNTNGGGTDADQYYDRPTANTIEQGQNSNTTNIMYSFASKRGVSKVGSYTGNGSTNGPKIYTGFEPAFLMFKCTSQSGSSWIIVDNKRATSNPRTPHLRANSSAGDDNGANEYVDFLEDGFQPKGVSNYNNNSSNQYYIYYAVAKDNTETSLIPDTDLELHLDADSFPEYGEAGYSNTPSTWTALTGSNGTISGATFDSELGNWLDFDGSNDFVDLGDINGNNAELTVSAWVNPDSTQLQYATIYDFEHSNDEGWVLYQDDNTTNSYRIALKDGASWDTADSFSLTANTWHHIVFTVNATGGAFELYINGVNTQSKSGWGGLGSQQKRLNLGCWGGVDGVTRSRFWNGQIGQFRMYSTVLTQAEVRQNYNFTKPNYPNGYDGTISGSTWNSEGYFSFDGSNDYIQISSILSTLQANTIITGAAWINPITATNNSIISFRSSANNTVKFFLAANSSGALYLVSASTGTFLVFGTTSSNLVPVGQWTHVAASINYETKAYYIYVNGQLASSGTQANIRGASTFNATSFLVGANKIGTQHCNLKIGQARIYDKTLNGTEIAALHSQGR